MPQVETPDIKPCSNTYLLGHKAEEDVFLSAWKNNSLHSSWLISGVKGIGKATFAYRFARFLLAADERQKEKYNTLEISPDNTVFRLMESNAHPDFKVIERDYTDTEKKKLLKAIKEGESLSESELQSLKKSAFIRVDDVRQIHDFFAKKSSGWRIVLIDSVDDMNLAAANALLKVLEEPPAKALLLLISNNPGKLLPTIRSRCAKINFSPLDEGMVASLLRRYRPELSENEVKKIAQVSSGSIGKAINYADNGALSLYEDLEKLIYAGSRFSTAALQEFCTKAAGDEKIYALTQELILKLLSVKIKACEDIESLAESWDETNAVFAETEALNLDKVQALMKIIVNMIKRI